MDNKPKPVVIEFPLRGEWNAPTTPAKKVPSHGTNRMGLQYAFDFLQLNWKHSLKLYSCGYQESIETEELQSLSDPLLDAF
ncbi:hypothetical protein MKY30_19155 [Oceanobacillus sp. FSL W8-0428]|uniref:Uncharacterized protein n=1 Tax=Oceanobacillus sojae TaxID=582851 RepID=A0A511ZJF5_9BACI|nr:hypothetical protein [Oceanobacillus sojae]GEN87581.1 hypothetical protein OSO01_23200 [Oceanobacillus sojae]